MTNFGRITLLFILLLGIRGLLAWSARADVEAKQGLEFSVGEAGLDSLSFNHQPLLASAKGGELQLAKSLLQTAAEAFLNKTSSPIAKRIQESNTIELTYPWGRISCAYRKKNENALVMHIQVINQSTESIDDLSLRLMELSFPTVPQGGSLEAGMFGYQFKGELSPLYKWPILIDARFAIPLVRVDYGTDTLNFCDDDFAAAVTVGSATNSDRTSYPFGITCHTIQPGGSKTFDVSFRFGPSGSTERDLSDDVIQAYATKYPFQVKWNDHRSIGAIYLASSGIKVPTNPRRWIMNSGHLDVTTDEGKQAFRTALLKLADASVSVLEDCHAQGMITWDPEGQEFLGACYYGDPRLTPILAPEMEFKGGGGTRAIDDYFEKFRAAGLKVGVCIRPQQIKMVNGAPMQQEADDEHAAQVLKEKIAYARNRWGCTLFYVDSTVTEHRSLNPDVFETLAKENPDVLIIPENESMRYFACSAPLNSYQHHRITSTPVGARTVYPKAFSVLMASEGDRPEDHQALVDSVRNGDILLFNCWYPNQGASKIKKIYEEAAQQH
jgi:hypothetical protein